MNTVLNKLEKLIRKEEDAYMSSSLAPLKEIEEILLKSIHLCNTCIETYPECKGKIIQFGVGYGKDNVIRCETYKLKI